MYLGAALPHMPTTWRTSFLPESSRYQDSGFAEYQHYTYISWDPISMYSIYRHKHIIQSFAKITLNSTTCLSIVIRLCKSFILSVLAKKASRQIFDKERLYPFICVTSIASELYIGLCNLFKPAYTTATPCVQNWLTRNISDAWRLSAAVLKAHKAGTLHNNPQTGNWQQTRPALYQLGFVEPIAVEARQKGLIRHSFDNRHGEH